MSEEQKSEYVSVTDQLARVQSVVTDQLAHVLSVVPDVSPHVQDSVTLLVGATESRVGYGAHSDWSDSFNVHSTSWSRPG